MDDEMPMAMKTNGGVVQMVAVRLCEADPPEGSALTSARQEFGVPGTRRRAVGRRTRRAAAAAPRCSVEGASPAPAPAGAGRGGRGATAGLETLAPDRRAEFERRMAEIDRKWPAAGRANVKDFVDHIDYAVKLIGVDHVGISSDFDGGGGIDGWNSAAETFNVTLEMVRRGYTEEQIGKIWSGNLLRVWGDVDKVAKSLQGQKGG
jgi:membrane dipeptidase